jgi:tetratricopeptide (TPR) repeat protein
LQPGGERRTHADLLYKRGSALRSLGRWEEALAGWREAVAAYQSVGDTDAIGRIYGTVCQQLLWSSRFEEALDLSLRGLAALGKRRSADRCILLAGGGLTLSLAGFYEPADRMMNEALALAEEVGDHHVTGRVLTYKAGHHFAYAQFAPALHESQRAIGLLRTAGDLWELCNAMWVNQFANLAFSGLDEAASIGNELIPLATRLGQLGALSFGMHARGYLELMLNGDIALFEELTKEDMEICRSAGLPGTSQTYSCLGLVAFWRGDWETALRQFEEAVAIELPGAFFGTDRPWIFLAKAYAGDRTGALAALRQKGRILPAGGTLRQKFSLATGLIRAARVSGFNGRMLWRMISQPGWTTLRKNLPRPHQANTIGASHTLAVLVEGYAMLGARDEAAKLYPDVINLIDATQSLIRFFADRLTQTVAGISAASGGQWEKAETHFQSALRQAHEIPHRLEQPEVRRWYARMLIDRDAPGDRDKARQLLREAIAMYREIGMPKHVEMAEALLNEAGQLAGPGVTTTKQT